MKTKIILVSTLFMLLSACNGDLDIINNSAVSSNSMWQEEGDATAAMYGLYNKFRSSFSEGYMYWGEYRTGLWGDGLTGQTSRDQVYQNQIPTNHTFADWTNLYTTINNANLILKHAQNIHFKTEESKNEVLVVYGETLLYSLMASSLTTKKDYSLQEILQMTYSNK